MSASLQRGLQRFGKMPPRGLERETARNEAETKASRHSVPRDSSIGPPRQARHNFHVGDASRPLESPLFHSSLFHQLLLILPSCGLTSIAIATFFSLYLVYQVNPWFWLSFTRLTPPSAPPDILKPRLECSLCARVSLIAPPTGSSLHLQLDDWTTLRPGSLCGPYRHDRPCVIDCLLLFLLLAQPTATAP